MRGDYVGVKRLIEVGSYVDAKNKDGLTASVYTSLKVSKI
jgi:hypothetical protein